MDLYKKISTNNLVQVFVNGFKSNNIIITDPFYQEGKKDFGSVNCLSRQRVTNIIVVFISVTQNLEFPLSNIIVIS